MSPTYYRLWYRLDNTDAYLLWFSNSLDGVVVQPDGSVPSFPTQASVRAYAHGRKLAIEEEAPILHNLDAVAGWLRHSRAADIDYHHCLAAWNLFTDVSTSTDGYFNLKRKRTCSIYDKLFWGSNLPVVTPAGEHYTPVWSGKEVKILRTTLAHGLTIFRNVVRSSSLKLPAR